MSLTIASSESASMLVTIQHIKSVDTTRLPRGQWWEYSWLGISSPLAGNGKISGAGFVNLVL
jgi:hypothetical protein